MSNKDGKSKGFGAAEQVSIWGASVLSKFQMS
jgi:hypothetical protein